LVENINNLLLSYDTADILIAFYRTHIYAVRYSRWRKPGPYNSPDYIFTFYITIIDAIGNDAL
jgi:hypothetical protein